MKNSQKGFVVPLLVAIIAVLVIGGGAYFYSKNLKPSGPTSYKNETLVNTYTVLSDENLWRGKYVSTTIPVEWNVPSKNVTVKKITENSFSCGDKQASFVNYTSYNAGSNYVGGWNSVSVIDCGNYYFVYESGDAGPKLYGPFDSQSATVSTKPKVTEPVNSSNQTISNEWKICTNTKYGYQAKYPATWKVWEPGSGTFMPASCDSNLSLISFSVGSSLTNPNINIEARDQNALVGTVFQGSKSVDDYLSRNPLIVGGNPVVKNSTINGEKLVWLDHNYMYTFHNGTAYIFSVYGVDQTTLNQFVSTFKFTNSGNSSVSPKVTSISPDVLPDGSTNTYYSQALTAVGFPTNDLTWTVVSGSLPTGFYLQKAMLVCDASIPAGCPDQSTVMFKASIGGMPTQEGTYPFSVKVDNGSQSATKSYTITIKPGFAIRTDKSSYSANDPIVMTMVVYNQTGVAKVFTFQTTCQTSYRINNLNGSNFFDSINNPSCPSTLTSVTVPAYGTYTWTVTHNPSTYRLPPGTYKIQGWIIGQARFDSAPITITN